MAGALRQGTAAGATFAARFDRQLLAYFEDHRRRWLAGQVKLSAHVQDWKTLPDGSRAPLWYARPLGEKVTIDKAAFFAAVGYRPSEPACLAHASLAKVRVFSGGARAGKSRWGGMELCPILLTPGTRTWIVAPEYEQGRREFEYVLEHTVEHPELGPKLKPFLKRCANRPSQGDMEIRFQWEDAGTSFLLVKTAQQPQSLLSEELDCVLVAEASEIPEDRWSRYLRMRLTTRQGIALFPTSPKGMGWVAELYRKGMDGEPGYFSVNVDSRMNPTLTADEVEFWSKDMSDEDFEEQVRGRPAPKAGRVYAGFDRGIHVESWRPEWPKPTWRRGRAIDFGFSDPFACLWVAEDEDRRLYVYREFYKRKVLIDDFVRHLALVEGWEHEVDKDTLKVKLSGICGRRERIDGPTIVDWDASDRAELARRGIRTRKADKDILAGVKTVSELLRVREDGRPRLYVHASCKNLIREFDVYEWDGRADQPKDKDNHALDALRYFAHTTQPHLRDLKLRVLQL